MGLNIRDIIPRKEIEISDLNGKILCVDAFNALYQFLSSVRQSDGTPLMDSHKKITSHLSGIFYRNISLLEEGIKLVYVFDGKPPDLKYKTHEKRSNSREYAKSRYETAKSEEDSEMMKRYSSQLIRLDKDMVEESKELLEAMGIPCVQAPSEGESEAAYLSNINERVYASASQDYDSLLFGAKVLVRNLTLARKRKTFNGFVEIKPELIELDKVLNSLEINLDQLICLGILVGTDYNPKGIPGIGQKKALDVVRKFVYPIEIFKSVEEKLMGLPEEDKFDWTEIFSLFHKPDVKKIDFKFDKIDEKKIREILVKRHEFSEERIEKQLERLIGIRDKQKQKSLGRWF
jgi:flap endonuclease-1